MNEWQGGCDDLISKVAKKEEPKYQAESQQGSEGKAEQKIIENAIDDGEKTRFSSMCAAPCMQ
jgi:hypothetical protein